MSAPVQDVLKVDDALIALFQGITVPNDAGGTDAVTVLCEPPDPEITPNRKYPAIAILFQDLVNDEGRLHSETGGEEVFRDDTSVPYIQHMRPDAEPKRLYYHIETHAVDGALQDRHLFQAVDRLLPSRGTINVDGALCWMFQTGFTRMDANVMAARGTSGSSRVAAQQRLYRKVFEVEILANLLWQAPHTQHKVIHAFTLNASQEVPAAASVSEVGLTLKLTE